MRNGILNKKFLIIVIGLFFLFSVIILLPRFLFGNKRQFLENIPDNPASQICQKISQPEDIYSCLAVVNQNASFCRNFDEPSQKELCQGLASGDIS